MNKINWTNVVYWLATVDDVKTKILLLSGNIFIPELSF